MPGDRHGFFGLDARTTVIRGGAEGRLNPIKGEDGIRRSGHKAGAVYLEQLMQITRDYSGLPDPRTLKMSEIRTFYDYLRGDLKQLSKGK